MIIYYISCCFSLILYVLWVYLGILFVEKRTSRSRSILESEYPRETWIAVPAPCWLMPAFLGVGTAACAAVIGERWYVEVWTSQRAVLSAAAIRSTGFGVIAITALCFGVLNFLASQRDPDKSLNARQKKRIADSVERTTRRLMEKHRQSK